MLSKTKPYHKMAEYYAYSNYYTDSEEEEILQQEYETECMSNYPITWENDHLYNNHREIPHQRNVSTTQNTGTSTRAVSNKCKATQKKILVPMHWKFPKVISSKTKKKKD